MDNADHDRSALHLGISGNLYPRLGSPSLRKRDPSPPWQGPFLLSFTGVRGVVSLAAALAIPYALANGQPFPHRELIQYVTFGVIIITIVGQGLMPVSYTHLRA